MLRRDLFEQLGQFLDHQIIELDNRNSSKLGLSDKDKQSLPKVLFLLNQLTEQWKSVQESNNMSDIEEFANDIQAIAEKYHCQPTLEYASELKEKIKVFDISGIQQQLKKFSTIQVELQRLI